MNTYLFIEGLLSETGAFTLYRGLETREALRSSSHFAGVATLELDQVDDNGDSRFVERLPLVFNHGCDLSKKVIGQAPVRAAIPLFPGASKLIARFRGIEVFTSPIGRSGPKLSGLTVKSFGHQAILEFTTDVMLDDVQVFARLADERLVKPRWEARNGDFVVDLNSLSGQGEVSLIVEATREMRTSRLEAGPVTTPAAEARGLILEPTDQSKWPYKKRGSLIAAVFDENGRQLNWEQSGLSWKVNGQTLKDDRQVGAWAPSEPGDYRIQLVKGSEQEEEVLSECKVEVLPPTVAQLKYEALMAAAFQDNSTPSLTHHPQHEGRST
ncbi:hypothetical protein GGR26_002685 [Lewinella marina]|uniref:Uncharacterized protein n=1 Tax=Neolewinella marina TaxID=438751 RepID=A0A2G0CD43_9BACT|nr:hypothetical protein [Neolewinella marina]NJB86908.1 hypothetical protein [Neolewinella marina]PHK97894.1 hypothetical protein CGL56_13860 [Neolewinella marina]